MLVEDEILVPKIKVTRKLNSWIYHSKSGKKNHSYATFNSVKHKVSILKRDISEYKLQN